MEITWFGHSCFRITERGMGTVVCDPFDAAETGFEPLKLKADIVTSSIDSPHHRHIAATQSAKSNPFVITGPGEYEINNVFIQGYQDYKHEKNGNTVFVIEYNGIFVAHLGRLKQMPTMAEIESFGTTHVMLVPIGGHETLNASQAVELISLIKPNFVIPMIYDDPLCKLELDPLTKFLKEMGITQTEDVMNSFKLTSTANLPEETKIIILNHPHVSDIVDDEPELDSEDETEDETEDESGEESEENE